MKSPKRLMALALAATLMCLPGASLAEDAAATDAPAAIEETTTVAEDPNEVLATVNGVEITRARFNTFYQSMLSYYGQYYDTTNESLQAAIRQSALEVAVQYELMNQKLVELGLSMGFMSYLINIGSLTLQTAINKLGQDRKSTRLNSSHIL